MHAQSDVTAPAFDHVVIAAPDLEMAKREFEARTGVAPVDGGPHVGLGTCNALVSFAAEGQGQNYLEIIAPDPDQDLNGTFGGRLAKLAEPELLEGSIHQQSGSGRRITEPAMHPGWPVPAATRPRSRIQPPAGLRRSRSGAV